MQDIQIQILPPKYGNILCITDPSNADILLNGILQSQKTSILLTNILTGNYTVSFRKAGYVIYTENITVAQNKTTNVCAILTQIVSIQNKGMVICSTQDILTCPISPIDCPLLTTPLDYINLIAILTSTTSINLTVRFIYLINGITNNTDVTVNLISGTNIIYAFSTNLQFPINTILSLEDVVLI